jgi:flagellar biosynthesis protein FlhA
MDGASKFVKGDAIAALLILAVNIIAGFASA